MYKILLNSPLKSFSESLILCVDAAREVILEKLERELRLVGRHFVPTPMGGHERKMPAHLALVEVDGVPTHLTAKSGVVVVPRVPRAHGVGVKAQVVDPLLRAFRGAHHVVVARVHQNLEVVRVGGVQELRVNGHHGGAAVRHVVANGARALGPNHGGVVFLRCAAIDVDGRLNKGKHKCTEGVNY